ncbi:MAG: hypothetical protein ACOYXB_17750 [Bacteroidota bacterium]
MRRKPFTGFVIFLLSLSFFLKGQTSSVGIYTGPTIVFRTDEPKYPENHFGQGFMYVQQVFFDLSVQGTAGLSRQLFINPDPLGPGNTENPWFGASAGVIYWALNDLRGLLSGQRENMRIQSDLVSSPFNFYLSGGAQFQFIVNNTDSGIPGKVFSLYGGAGIQSYLPFKREFRGFILFAEGLYNYPLSSYYRWNEEKYSFSFFSVRGGIRYSFARNWENRFN